MRKTVFLDRDGVLNEDKIGSYITRPEDLKIHKGVIPGLKALDAAGYRLLMVSNQAGIGDGVFSQKDLERVHGRMERILRAHGILFDGCYYCFHGKTDGCGCRKPMPGLFFQAAEDFAIDRKNSFFIGDKISDMDAGHAFGVTFIMLRTGHGASEEKRLTVCRPAYLVNTFTDAVNVILAKG